MAQDDSEQPLLTRTNTSESEINNESQPRIGRRESEPHSIEVAYIHDVLTTNFSEHHCLLDLHHYFQLEDEEIDVQFDISFFLNFKLPHTLSSYRAIEYQNRIPDMAINILSKSTWRKDFSDNLEFVRMLKIPVYIVFTPFDVASRPYKAPFLRVYFLQPDGNYLFRDIRSVARKQNGLTDLQDFIDLDNYLPFLVGLIKLEKTHENWKPLFRLIFKMKSDGKILQNKTEQEKQRADQEKQRAEKYLNLLKKHGIDHEN